MKIRIKFRKFGNMKFIGHLDVMRYFQKAIRRADVDIRYSEGFSPHQIMSFAAPLGVGITSNGEYVDIEVLSSGSSEEMCRRLNAAMAEGFEILSYRLLPDDAGNAMSIVAAADYRVSLRPGYSPFGKLEQGSLAEDDPETAKQTMEFMKGLLAFYNQEQVLVTKKTKRGQRELDLKPLIYRLDFIEAGKLPDLFMKISNGSAANIKPDMVLAAYYQSLGQEKPAFAWMYQREEVYADRASEQEKEAGIHSFISLEDLGEEIS